MFCPPRGLRFGTLLPVIVLLAVTGFFMPGDVPDVADGAERPLAIGEAGDWVPWAALPGHPILRTFSGVLDLPRMPRSAERQGRHGSALGQGRAGQGRKGPSLRFGRTPSSAGARGRGRLASVGRLSSPATAPPLLRTPGA